MLITHRYAGRTTRYGDDTTLVGRANGTDRPTGKRGSGTSETCHAGGAPLGREITIHLPGKPALSAFRIAQHPKLDSVGKPCGWRAATGTAHVQAATFLDSPRCDRAPGAMPLCWTCGFSHSCPAPAAKRAPPVTSHSIISASPPSVPPRAYLGERSVEPRTGPVAVPARKFLRDFAGDRTGRLHRRSKGSVGRVLCNTFIRDTAKSRTTFCPESKLFHQLRW